MIDLFDRRAEKAIEYMKLNRRGRTLDEDDYSIIWNEMSACVSDFCALLRKHETLRKAYLRSL